jgi:hypothetical protein
LEPAFAVGNALTITVYIAEAGKQKALETDIVKVTVVPSSPAAAV